MKIRPLSLAVITATTIVVPSTNANLLEKLQQAAPAILHPAGAINIGVGGSIAKEIIKAAPPEVAAPVAVLTAPLTAADQCLKSLGWKDCSEAVMVATPMASQATLCLSNLRTCPENVVKTLSTNQLLPAARQIVQAYKQGLVAQATAKGKWMPVPEEFIKSYAYAFPGVNLREVRVATGINTIHGQAITFATQIFLPQASLDLKDRDDRILLLHELEHTLQYQRKGGEQPFVDEYLRKGAGQIVACLCFNVHDSIDVEHEAIVTAQNSVDKPSWSGRLAIATEAVRAWFARQ